VPYINSSWWAWIESCQAQSVVIFDPNWNPAQDLQAQDRSFRFGQKRVFVVFRLLAAGSFENLFIPSSVQTAAVKYCCFRKIENRYFEGVQVAFFNGRAGVWVSYFLGVFYLY
ncbi:hypothetical protein H0E87_028700, partial [Populus deltoides]